MEKISASAMEYGVCDQKMQFGRYGREKSIGRWKLGKRNLASIGMLCFEILFLVCGMSLVKPVELNETIKAVGVIAFVCMMVSCLAVYYINRILDFSIIYTILAYLFSFGQSILMAFGYHLDRSSAFSVNNGHFTAEEVYGSSYFALLAICFTCIGICLSNHKKQRRIKNRPCFRNENKIRRLGWYLLFLGLFPALYCAYLDIKTIFTLSYGATIQDYRGIGKICSLISGFFISGILMLLCFEKSKNKRMVLWAILGFYMILQLATGSRLTIIRLGIVILLLWNLLFKNITRQRFWMIVIGCFTALFVLSMVSSVRIYISSSSDLGQLLIRSAGNLIKNNYLFKLIAEMGNTQMINLLVYKHCPSESPFQLGFSYLKILWAIIPNVLGITNTNYIGVDITFSALYKRTGAPMGASFVAEGYWNFGWISLVLFAVFGAFLGKINDNYNSLCNSDGTKAAIELFLTVYVIYYMLFMVRGELLGFGRSFVYYAVIPLILSWIRLPKCR